MNDQSLLARASLLTAQVSWVKAYRQQWLMIAIATEKAVSLLGETDKPDMAAKDFLDSAKSMAIDKCAKLEKWLERKQAEQNRMMEEVDPDVAINR